MKKRLLTLVLAIMVLGLASCGADGESKKKADDVSKSSDAKMDAKENIGEFETVDLDGNKVTQDIFKENELTMVNMFSSTCNPCMEELPALAELSEELKDRKIGIVGLNIDMDSEGMPDKDSAEAVKKMIGDKSMKAIFVEFNLMDKILTKTDAVPYTFFVDKEGNIVGNEYVGNHSKEEWQKIIDDELKGL